MPPAAPKKPADVSAASKEPNEYIPSFISKKPFYAVPSEDSTSDYLDHQRLQQPLRDQSAWYDRGKRAGPAATKFRKGACENCGAVTHKTKECLSRPRKAGAKWTGKNIEADELLQDVELGWDAKRDRWNGYDASEYGAVVDEFAELETLRKAAGSPTSPTGSDDETGPADESKLKQPKGTRQLRLREDTAKYLLNLDLDSARYDPKTRSMVDGGAYAADQAAALVAEDNFMRASGDAAEFEKAQRYAWEAQERGGKAAQQHIQANPTSGEFLRKREREEAAQRREQQQKLLLEKYGAQPAPATLPLQTSESETFTEYDALGQPKSLKAVSSTRSKYPEDVHPHNHTSVWGSWWTRGQWGYECCHSTVKNSYCTGAAGRAAFAAARDVKSVLALDEASPGRMAEEESQQGAGNSAPARRKPAEDPPDAEAEAHPESRGQTTKKRTLAEMRGGVSEEDLDAYRRARAAPDDPMAKMLGSDALLDVPSR
ncbi:MAG: mRNA splicing protein [Thelocarpon impressellum]|nr:MAG: mRNA splicing protein [Thelocarpon impressellum]